MIPYLNAISELSRITHDLVSRICSTEASPGRRRSKAPELHVLDLKLCQWVKNLPTSLKWNRWHTTAHLLHPHVASL